MTDYIDSLQQTGDFLTITRNHEWHLAPCRFTLENQTTVEVWDTGVICFEPANAGDKDIVLSSAVHGNETAPIEICDDLIAKVIKQEIELKHRVLFLFGNPAAMNIAKRFVEENLNRLFSGAHSHGPGLVNKERERAKKLEHYVARFFTSVEPGRYRCHYDLHTAIRGSKNEKFAIYPYLHGGKWRKDQFQLLAACGVKTFLLMGSSATTFAYFSSNSFNADAFTVELGKVRPFGENDMTRFAAAADTLERLICGRDLNLPEFNAEEMEFFDVYRIVNRYTDDFELNFPDDELNFTDFPIGYVLARDGDKEHVVDKEGEAIVFPLANVAKGQRALITVVPMDVSDNLI